MGWVYQLSRNITLKHLKEISFWGYIDIYIYLLIEFKTVRLYFFFSSSSWDIACNFRQIKFLFGVTNKIRVIWVFERRTSNFFILLYSFARGIGLYAVPLGAFLFNQTCSWGQHGLTHTIYIFSRTGLICLSIQASSGGRSVRYEHPTQHSVI